MLLILLFKLIIIYQSIEVKASVKVLLQTYEAFWKFKILIHILNAE